MTAKVDVEAASNAPTGNIPTPVKSTTITEHAQATAAVLAETKPVAVAELYLAIAVEMYAGAACAPEQVGDFLRQCIRH